MNSQTLERLDQENAVQVASTPSLGLTAAANTDQPKVDGGKLPDKPETLKTFTIDLDDAWALP